MSSEQNRDHERDWQAVEDVNAEPTHRIDVGARPPAPEPPGRIPRPLVGITAAFALFSIIPAPVIPGIDRRVAARAIRAFPWMGALLGVVAGLIAGGVLAAGAGPWLAGVLALGWLAAATGGFHLDGVADTADGLGSRKPAPAALAIMKQSDIGPMGVISLVMVLLIDLGSLTSLTATSAALGAGSWWRVGLLILVGPVVGRASILLATLPGVPCARPGGFGSLVAGVTTPRAAAVDLAAVGVLSAGLGWLVASWVGALLVLVACALALGWAQGWTRHLVRRLGGMTGDCFGSLNETTQAVAWGLMAIGAALLW